MINKEALADSRNYMCDYCEKIADTPETHHGVVPKNRLGKQQQNERNIDDEMNLFFLCKICHGFVVKMPFWGVEKAIVYYGEEAVQAMCQRLLPLTWRGVYTWNL